MDTAKVPAEVPEDSRVMMIAFITIKSSLVPLIEGLCAQIYLRFVKSVQFMVPDLQLPRHLAHPLRNNPV